MLYLNGMRETPQWWKNKRLAQFERTERRGKEAKPGKASEAPVGRSLPNSTPRSAPSKMQTKKPYPNADDISGLAIRSRPSHTQSRLSHHPSRTLLEVPSDPPGSYYCTGVGITTPCLPVCLRVQNNQIQIDGQVIRRCTARALSG